MVKHRPNGPRPTEQQDDQPGRSAIPRAHRGDPRIPTQFSFHRGRDAANLVRTAYPGCRPDSGSFRWPLGGTPGRSPFVATISLMPSDTDNEGGGGGGGGAIGMLASLAGGAGGAGGVPKFQQFLSSIGSVGVAQVLDRKYDMVCVIYRGLCDPRPIPGKNAPAGTRHSTLFWRVSVGCLIPMAAYRRRSGAVQCRGDRRQQGQGHRTDHVELFQPRSQSRIRLSHEGVPRHQ